MGLADAVAPLERRHRDEVEAEAVFPEGLVDGDEEGIVLAVGRVGLWGDKLIVLQGVIHPCGHLVLGTVVLQGGSK